MANDETLIRKRGAMKAKVTNFGNFISMITNSKTISNLQRLELEDRLSRFSALYDEFDELQLEIETLGAVPTDQYAERADFEERYYALAAQARSLLPAPSITARADDNGSVAGSSKYTGASPHNFIRLPKIDLPSFDGCYQSWLEYRDTFSSLIHNSSCIDDISKFHYLRASLKGAAQEIIKNIDFYGDNYTMAWNLLCERYNNSRLLIHNHVQALFNANSVTRESSISLRTLIDTINKNIRALKALKEPTEHWDTLVVFMMASKLDAVTNRNWEEYRNTLNQSPTLSQFCTFLSNKADLLETIEHQQVNNKIEKGTQNYIINYTNTKNNNNKIIQNKQENLIKNNQINNKLNCPLCFKNHFLYTCERFRGFTVEARIEKVKELNVCFNCLRSGHLTKKCRLSRCRYCKGRHNTLLHVETSSASNHQDPMPNASNSVALPIDVDKHDLTNCSSNDVVLSSSTLHQTTSSQILLSTALVKVLSHDGERVDARLLLDNGSTANFITQSLCDKLRLPRCDTSSTITGIDNQTSFSTQSCNLIIESRHSRYKIDIKCFILNEITKALPSTLIDVNNIPIPSNINLADPSFFIPSNIDILVGAEVFWDVLGSASINLGKNQPKLFETKLGWIASGHVTVPLLYPVSLHHFCNSAVLTELQTGLDKFWELDSVSSKHALSQEERACEESFRIDTVRNDNGSFVVKIPLKQNPSVLGESYEMAKRRFLSLERRFQRDPVFKESYIAFMLEYERLGHMKENSEFVKPHSGHQIEYFIPHHGVIRESSTTTKLRAVFDASAVTTSGLSFNNIQMVGPTVQDELLAILLRYRQHKFVISSDVEKMYRAIEVSPSQRSLQQIIFRTSPELPLKTYTLNTVTYGTASAPYLATKCLVSLAESTSNPRVKNSIQRDFYVDDYLSGGNTISETVQLGKEVDTILSSANFHLRKWKSNSSEVLKQITGISTDSCNLDLSENKNVSSKTLGLHWLCGSDELAFSIDVDVKDTVTKRHILSTISQIFDPLGIAGPCVVEAKLIMQKLWIAKCDWDERVPDDINVLWNSFVKTLPALNLIKIPRWVVCEDAIMHEIHTFVDASEKAYGTCIYVRSTNNKGCIKVQLLVSKNRVAPIKPITIPRLELCGALLGTRLCKKVLESLTLPISNCYFWCDSTIVLNWLSMSPSLLKPFVRNRVDEIQEVTSGYTWSYVPSRDNPADLVSRGLNADLISGNCLWWSGPSFLLKCNTDWPRMPKDNMKQDLPELSTTQFKDNNTYNLNLIHNTNNKLIINSLIHKYSSFDKLQRIIAYIHRFIHNIKNKNSKIQTLLTSKELSDSLKILLYHGQIDMFPEEYKLLKLGSPLPRKNRLISLSPFIDSDNLIRVGGRLDNSPYDYDVKHPILLCSKHYLTKILFIKFHNDLLHAGPQLLLASIRNAYWPIGGRNLSKRTVKGCIKCFKHKCQNIQPIMGQLPISRTQLEFPFLKCSVDYAGPVLIADRKGRGCKLLKAYLCIFVCLAVKAIHIELVTDLSKEAYIAALNRFVARRGKPQSILSDNGTNFVGASNELHRFLHDSNIAFDVEQQGIEFAFTPPYSPHFNGIAEAAVRSTKHHLRRMLKLTHFTFEEMCTYLYQIEAVLNSRPITPLSSDPTDLTALTPSHFLIGRPLTSIPHPQVPDVQINRLERYRRVELLKQHFWNRFAAEYVSLLQQKTKWTTTSGQLSVGTLVLIKERGQPPLLWLLGRVTRVFPGRDGPTRVAELKTKKGIILRSFNNLCPLPLS